MAVDTAAKRASATLFLVPSMAPGVFPDGTIGQGDRQASVWNYSGILAGVAVIVTPPPSGSSGGRGRGRVWAWEPEVKKVTHFKFDEERDKRLKRLLKLTLNRKKRQKDLERIAKIAAENVHAAMDIRRITEELERELRASSRLRQISEKKRIRQVEQLREEEEIIVALLLMNL